MGRKSNGDIGLHRTILSEQSKELKDWIFIPMNVPSSKNNRVFTGTSLIENKRCHTYRKGTAGHWEKNKETFERMKIGREKPYFLMFLFVRGTHHKFDYCNMLQLPQDLMTEHGWIEDDNCTELIPVIVPYRYDKEKPGLYLKIL